MITTELIIWSIIVHSHIVHTLRPPSSVLRAFTSTLSTSLLSALSLLGGSLRPLIHLPVLTREDSTKSGSNSALVSFEESRSVTCLASCSDSYKVILITLQRISGSFIWNM